MQTCVCVRPVFVICNRAQCLCAQDGAWDYMKTQRAGTLTFTKAGVSCLQVRKLSHLNFLFSWDIFYFCKTKNALCKHRDIFTGFYRTF